MLILLLLLAAHAASSKDRRPGYGAGSGDTPEGLAIAHAMGMRPQFWAPPLRKKACCAGCANGQGCS